VITRFAMLLVALIWLTTAAAAQQRVTYGSDGKAIARSVTGSDGTTVTYDASTGKVITREAITGNTTTIYDKTGRAIAKATRERR
jgi:hypothetical protein